MIVHQVETFQIDERRPIIGCPRVFQDTHDSELVAVPCAFRIAVRWREAVADPDLHFACHRRSHNGLEIAMLFTPVFEVASRGKFKGLITGWAVAELVEHVRRRAHDTKLTEIVAQTNGDREGGELAEPAAAIQVQQLLAARFKQLTSNFRAETSQGDTRIGIDAQQDVQRFPLGLVNFAANRISQPCLTFGRRDKLEVVFVRNILDRLAQIEDRVHGQLELAALGTNNLVVAQARVIAERLCDHTVHRQDGHHHHDTQCHGNGGQE